MTDPVGEAAALIARARERARPIDGFPDLLRAPADGYRVQDALARRSGVAGWKVGALTAFQQRRLGVAQPVAAPLLAPFVKPSPARFAAGAFIHPTVEAEFAFVLGRDLPPRGAGYTADDIGRAVAAICPAIEVVDARVRGATPPPVAIADFLGNGAFVHGAAQEDWRRFDLRDHPVVLQVGTRAAAGSSAAILGNPLAAVLILANAQPPVAGGLKAGQIVTTGSCTGITAIEPGEEAVADFGPLGQVRVALTVDEPA